MNIKKESITVNETVMRGNSKVQVAGEVIVPDVKSDIAKILKIDADAVVENCICSGGKAEISGKVYLTILYVPENDAKPVCAINTDMTFQSRIEDARISETVKCICTPDVYNVEYNVLNSRKLSVKTVVNLKISAIDTREEEFMVSLNEPDFETMEEQEKIYSLVVFKNVGFTLQEMVEFPQGKPSAVSLLKTDVKLLEYAIHIITGKIVIKGVVESTSLYISEEGKPEFVVCEIPFTEVIDAGGVTEESMCNLELSLLSTCSSLKADADTDMRIIDLEILFSAEVTAYEESQISLISDCFSLDASYDCKQKEIKLEKLMYKDEIRHNLKGVMSVSENMPQIVTIYNLMVKPYIENVTANGATALVEGSCDCYILYLSDKETTPICSAMVNLPFSFNVNSNNISADCLINTNIRVGSSSYNISLSGEVEIRASLDIGLTVTKPYEKKFVSDIIPYEGEVEKRHGIAVYFAKKGDSLWKIAKCYRVSLKRLIELNKPENPDLIYPGQPILIPLP